jgi:hypothetical protein
MTEHVHKPFMDKMSLDKYFNSHLKFLKKHSYQWLCLKQASKTVVKHGNAHN